MPERTITPVDTHENSAPWDRVLEQGIRNVLERKQQFLKRGIIDGAGLRLNTDLPPDMHEQSPTSV